VRRDDPDEGLPIDQTALDKHVGSEIAKRRLALTMSAATLADLLSISTGVLSAYERGTNSVSGQRLVEIAKVLRVSPSFFFHKFTQPKSAGHDNADPEISDVAASDALIVSNIVANIRDRAVRLAIIEHAVKACAAVPAPPSARAAR